MPKITLKTSPIWRYVLLALVISLGFALVLMLVPINTAVWWGRTVQVGLYIGLGLTLISIPLNLLGRRQFDPVGSDTFRFDSSNLRPGKNKVEYISDGSKIVADLYMPDDFVAGEKRPVVVITPPNSGVKEQTAGLYAQKLSQKGFITVAFDPRGFGESGGHSLYLDISRQVDDVKSSIDFVSNLEQVDTNNIFNMGICVGTGISAYETAYDSRIKAEAMVSPTFLSEDESVLPIPLDLVYMIGGAAKLWYLATGRDIKFGPMVPEVAIEDADEDKIKVGMGAFYYLPGMPGDVPNWQNRVSILSLIPIIEWLNFFGLTKRFRSTPVFMAYGSNAFSKGSAIKFYDQLDGPKDRLVLDGAGHFDMYWKPEYVDPVVESISKFFNRQVELELGENNAK
ncbi:alpha/beta hydrolase [Candidatus Leptofilum sp.]|uniref:alpha/beta hydrolase n=1 Tax=Candidatus Leptofilum sp. TaxID=3241576 RepID=UPI003B5A9AFB